MGQWVQAHSFFDIVFIILIDSLPLNRMTLLSCLVEKVGVLAAGGLEQFLMRGCRFE